MSSAGSPQVPALESVEQGGVSNHTEAALIHMLLSLLIKVYFLQNKIHHTSLKTSLFLKKSFLFIFFVPVF